MESLLVAWPGHLYGNGVLGRAAIKTNGNKSSSEEVTNKLQFPLGMRRYENLLTVVVQNLLNLLFFGHLKNLLYRWPSNVQRRMFSIVPSAVSMTLAPVDSVCPVSPINRSHKILWVYDKVIGAQSARHSVFL